MASRAPTKALALLVWARLSSTLQLSARFTRPPPMPSPPGFVRMFAAPPASTPLSCPLLRPSVRAVLRSPSRLPLPLVPAPPGVRIRMLAAPKRGAAVDSYQTVAVLCNAAPSTWHVARLAAAPCGRPPRREPCRSPRLPSGPERSALAAWLPKREAAAALWCLGQRRQSHYLWPPISPPPLTIQARAAARGCSATRRRTA
eukprot:scaffold39050_cov61-Phaeocystis_antarctica.AAC.3